MWKSFKQDMIAVSLPCNRLDGKTAMLIFTSGPTDDWRVCGDDHVSRHRLSTARIVVCNSLHPLPRFIFLGLGTIKTAQDSVSAAQTQTATVLAQGTIMQISVGMGLSLLVTAWTFYRITGGLFNPAVTLALWLIGAVHSVRAIMLTIAQLVRLRMAHWIDK